MAFMGYETPVEMPSMGVYNTDLMKMYIAGVKDQYEKGQEEMKDFMKLYADFYSDIPGATEAYNQMTIGGARNMINQMMAAGIDPYKSPEARAAISRYIASVPTGVLNLMKKSAENAKEYKKALAEALNDPNFDPEYNRYMIGGDLETWDPRKPWTATSPYIAPSMEEVAKPYMEKFKQSEILESDRPGYIKLGTTDKNQQAAIRGTLEMYEHTPYGLYKRQQADKIAASATDSAGNPLTQEQRKALSDLIFMQPVNDYARQFFQPAYEYNKIADQLREFLHDIFMEAYKHNNAMEEKGYKLDPKTKRWVAPDEKDNPVGISITNSIRDHGLKIVTQQTGTANLEKGQRKMLGAWLQTAKGHLTDAKGFMDQAFKQQLSGKYFSLLATGVKNDSGTINYKPGYANNIKTYTEVANNLATGSPYILKIKDKYGNRDEAFRFKGARMPGYGSNSWRDTTGGDITTALNKKYDPSYSSHIRIHHNGGAYSVLEKDGRLHEYAPVTIVMYKYEDLQNGKQLEKADTKVNCLYEITAAADIRTGQFDPKTSSESIFNDQLATQAGGITKNSNNKTVVIELL